MPDTPPDSMDDLRQKAADTFHVLIIGIGILLLSFAVTSRISFGEALGVAVCIGAAMMLRKLGPAKKKPA